MINWEQQFVESFITKLVTLQPKLNEWVLIETEPYRLKHPYKDNWVCPNAEYKAVRISDLKSGDKVVLDCYGKRWDFHSEDAANNWNFDRPSSWSWVTIE